MKENPFADRVVEALARYPGLRELPVRETRYDPEHFGNAVVALEGRNILLRFVNDRGDVYVEVSRRGGAEDWSLVQRALRAITGEDEPSDGLLSVEAATQLLDANLALLEKGYGPDEYPATGDRLRRLEAQAGRQFLESSDREGS